MEQLLATKSKHVYGPPAEHQSGLVKACAEISLEQGEVVDVRHELALAGVDAEPWLSTLILYRARVTREELTTALHGQEVPHLSA